MTPMTITRILGISVALLALMAPRPLAAQAPPVNGHKQAHAVEVASGAVRVDGRLDEPIWQQAPPVTDFVQREPNEGAPPTDPMQVRFAYDNDALYVGARMESAASIESPMGRRDDVFKAERLLISLDAYLDHRTASTFGVTASGVRVDHYYSSDNSARNFDRTFDPVWEARTAQTEGGWTAEFRIPFSQLRFNERSPQVWGLNIQRVVPVRNEEVQWALVRRTEAGWASRFGELHGIDGIRPARRLELMPYVGSASRIAGDRDRANPFESAANLEGRTGIDAKMGVGPNLTLEATINPDFGQVEADPAEVNLSAFETFFAERRPFFLEGIQLLRGTDNSYFYSRRIGAPPTAPASGEFVDYPSTTTILGAGKLTGRLASGTSVAVLAAATGKESARTYSRVPQFGHVRVAPQASYAVARLQQEFGSAGSSVGLMTTAVHRELGEGDALSALLARNAFTLSGDSVLRLKDGDYEMQLDLGLSYLEGDPRAINRIQRSSARYLQRPDAGYVAYNPLRGSLAGGRGGVRVSRRNARHWVWQASTGFSSPEFETNDVGRLNSTDALTSSLFVYYQQTEPGPRVRALQVRFRNDNTWNYAGDRQSTQLIPSIDFTFANYLELELVATMSLAAQDERLTRGGPSMGTPRWWRVNLEIEQNEEASTRAETELDFGRDENGGIRYHALSGLWIQPASSRWQLSIEPWFERRLDTQQYVATLEGGRTATYGRRYVFAHVKRMTYSTKFRFSYTFLPDLTLDFYVEPFASSGRYSHFGEQSAARSRLLREYGTDGTAVTTLGDGSRRVTDGASAFTLENRDFRVQSLRSNLVLRWEWRPGSTLYVVWQQDRAAREEFGNRVTPADMFDAFGTPGDHLFAIKTSFWLSLD